MNEHLDTILLEFEKVWTALQKPIFHTPNSKITATNLLISLLAIYLTVKLAKYLGRTLNKYLGTREVDSGVRDSIERFTRYAVIIIGVMLALDNLGISLNSLAAVGAVLMVGIGFGLQNITQNFVSGIILLLERPIKVGDIVRVANTSGRVLDIRARSTIVQTRDESTIIVPNSKLVSEEVYNDSYSGKRIRQHVKVGVTYDCDVEQVSKILCEAALQHAVVLKDPAPKAVLLDFGDSALQFEVRFWSTDLWRMELTASDIRFEIFKKFREAKIEIPYPHQVQVKKEESPISPH